VICEESSFPISEDSSPPTQATIDFLEDFTNRVSFPFAPSPSLLLAGTSSTA
jgi:hypothetical protein